MIITRKSPSETRNAAVVERKDLAAQRNGAWLSRHDPVGSLIFLGGSSMADFRVRVAQSHLRHDLLPSFWSLVGIMTAGDSFLAAPLAAGPDISAVPSSNGITICRLTDYDDPARYPNIALVRFTDRSPEIIQNGERLRMQRSAVDLPSMLVAWLGFVWGAGTRTNPLLQDIGLPSAALVETAFGMSGIELTPGIASASSCPEAIWQSAIWWHDYYEAIGGSEPAAGAKSKKSEPRTTAPRPVVPHGEFTIRQPAAAVTSEPPSQSTAASPPTEGQRGSRRQGRQSKTKR